MQKILSIKIYNYILFIFVIFFSNSILALNTIATHAIIIDDDTGDILFDKNANEITPPASMTKIMTSYIVFDRIKNTNLSLDDEFIISSSFWAIGICSIIGIICCNNIYRYHSNQLKLSYQFDQE